MPIPLYKDTKKTNKEKSEKNMLKKHVINTNYI